MFLIFKQHYTYFYILFYSHVFKKIKKWKLLFKHTYQTDVTNLYAWENLKPIKETRGQQIPSMKATSNCN